MRILYCGQKPIGEFCFAELLARRKEGMTVVGAVSNTSIDCWWRSAGVSDMASATGIPFLRNDRKDEAALLDFIKGTRPQVLLSVQHPWILSEKVLATVQGMALNLHLAPLPEYKGWYGCSHAILDQCVEFGVSLHWMMPRVDSGDIAYEARFPIESRDTAQRLYARAVDAGEGLFRILLDDLAAGHAPPRRPLVGNGRFYRRTDLDRRRELTCCGDLEAVARIARAFYFPPFEPAYIRTGLEKVYLVPAEAA